MLSVPYNQPYTEADYDKWLFPAEEITTEGVDD